MRAGGVTVVDALPAFPYGQRHLPGALNLTEEDVDAQDDLPPDATIITYFTNAACGRGEALTVRLEWLETSTCASTSDGIEDRVAAGFPVD